MNANDRAITALVMLAHGAVHVYEMVIPLFVVSWLLEFETIGLGLTSVDVTAASVGIVVTAGYALFGLGSLPSGILVDRVGSRPLISLCLLGMGGSYLLLGSAPNMLVVGLALVLWGLTASLYHPAALSLISNGVEDRGTGLAYHGIAGNLGIGLGPLVAVVALLFVDWRTLALALGVPALVLAAYAARASFDEMAAVEPAVADGGLATDGGVTPDRGVGSLSELVGDSKRLFAGSFAFVFLVVVSSGLYYRGSLTFLPEMLQNMPGFAPVPVDGILAEIPFLSADSVGEGRTIEPQQYFYSGLLLIGVLGQYLGGKLTDRVPVEYGIAGTFLVLAVLGLAFVPASQMGIVPLMVVGALLGVFLFLLQPMYQATVAEYSSPENRGLAYGFTYVGMFGVGALGGAVAGAILTYLTVGALFLTLAGFAVVGATVGLVLRRAGRSSAAA